MSEDQPEIPTTQTETQEIKKILTEDEQIVGIDSSPSTSESLDLPLSEEDTKEIRNTFESPILEIDEKEIVNNLDIKREDTRSLLAKTLIWIFGGTYLFTICVMLSVMFMPVNYKEQRTERYNYSKDVFSLLMSTQTGIIGAVLGFYFGSNRNKNS